MSRPTPPPTPRSTRPAGSCGCRPSATGTARSPRPARARHQISCKGFLVELLALECDGREARRKPRLVREAAFPRPKRIEDFDYAANPNVPAALIHPPAKGAWLAAGQPCCLIG